MTPAQQTEWDLLVSNAQRQLNSTCPLAQDEAITAMAEHEETLRRSHAELLKFVIAERDAFFESSTNAEGQFTDPDNATELAEMDALIERARAVQA